MPGPIALQPGRYYHIFNRGNNRENIFIEKDNYSYFLKLYSKYIVPIAKSYAYGLLLNHFHILVKIKTLEECSSYLKGPKDLSGMMIYNPSRQFGHFFNAYAKTINNRYKRTGSLFQKPFRRVEIKNESHLLRTVIYIHQNPQKHGFISDFRLWPYTSYQSFLFPGLSHIQREEVLSWFNGEQDFCDSHQVFSESQEMRSWILDV